VCVCFLGVSWEMGGQLLAPAALPPGKSPKYQLHMVGGLQSRPGRYDKAKIVPLPRFELRLLGHPTRGQSP
jgi:hypothetical protein